MLLRHQVRLRPIKTSSTSGLVTKMQYDSDKQVFRKIEDVDKKIKNVSGMVKRNKNKIPSFIDLVTTAAFNIKSSETESKYLTLLMGL